MTAFDAPLAGRGGSVWREAAAIIGARPGVLAAAIIAAATVVCVALLALVAGSELRFQAARAVDSVQASVFMRPQASRAAAEALKEPLQALPFVRGATLRTKEAAIASLQTSGSPPVGYRTNPLPDVWIVALALDAPDNASTLASRASEARRSLELLGDVESVDIDTGWLSTLEHWQALSTNGYRAGLAVVFGSVWLVLVCLFLLAGRALAGASPEHGDGIGGGAAAVLGVLIGSATLIAAAVLLAAATIGMESTGIDWRPILLRAGRMSARSITALSIGTLVLSTAVVWSARRRR